MAKRRLVGQVVGGVGDKAEQRAQGERRRPAPALEPRQHGEDDDADDIEQVERRRRRHLGAIEHHVADDGDTAGRKPVDQFVRARIRDLGQQ